jgi:hypothetical protein
MSDIQDLKKFLVAAKKATYASGDGNIENREEDGSTSLIFEAGDFKYHDNYFGGEPYGGREVVLYKGKPFYIMVYYGFVNQDVDDIKAVYGVLRKALMSIPEEHPYRGPKELIDGDYRYSNKYNGEVDNFFGEESIEYNGKKIYEAKYIGGLVDKKRE